MKSEKEARVGTEPSPILVEGKVPTTSVTKPSPILVEGKTKTQMRGGGNKQYIINADIDDWNSYFGLQFLSCV